MLPAALVDGHTAGPRLLTQLSAGGYLLAAGLFVVLLQFTSIRHSVLAIAGFVTDFANAALIALTGAETVLAVAIGFTLLSVAYRWGFAATFGTAAAFSAIHVAHIFVTPILAGAPEMTIAAVPAGALAARAAYFLVGGVLVGYLVQTDRQMRIESALVADVASRLDVRLGLTRSVAIALDAVRASFGARRAVLVVYDHESQRMTRWDCPGLGEAPAAEAVRVAHLDKSAAATYLSTPAGSAVHVVRRHGASGEGLQGITAEGYSARVPEALGAALGTFEQLIAVGIEMPREWTGCVFLMDPRLSRDRAGVLASAQRLARRLAPAIYNVYLLRRIRGRSVAEERARLARELHDTVVQSILGVQVQLHALAVQARGGRRELADELTRLGLTLREEVLRLREMMRHMKPIDPTPDQLMDAIAALVQRFETETGIRTRFITRADQVPLLPRACLEVMRIVQEALVNVRRHSGAQNVFIRFAVDDEVCSLSVEDDGNGFPFVGRLSLSELDSRHQGPSVIKDRVRRLGGEITIESTQGHGSRLDISFPVSMYALQ